MLRKTIFISKWVLAGYEAVVELEAAALDPWWPRGHVDVDGSHHDSRCLQPGGVQVSSGEQHWLRSLFGRSGKGRDLYGHWVQRYPGSTNSLFFNKVYSIIVFLSLAACDIKTIHIFVFRVGFKGRRASATNELTFVLTFCSRVYPRLAKSPLKFDGGLENIGLISLVKQATGCITVTQ